MDEYTEFLKVTTSLTGPQLITSMEELESSIKEQETDPDPYIMKKIAYTYLADDVVCLVYVYWKGWIKFLVSSEPI